MSASESRLQWPPPSLLKGDFLRVLVFQDGDHSGRTVLWDSALVVDSAHASGPAVPSRRFKDEQLLGELMFGSVPLAYQATSVKLHQLTDPTRIMISSIFRPAEAEMEQPAGASAIPIRGRGGRGAQSEAGPALQSLPATIALPTRTELDQQRQAYEGPVYAQDDLSQVPRTSVGAPGSLAGSRAGSVTSANTALSTSHMARRTVRTAQLDMRHGIRSPPADSRRSRRGLLPRLGIAVLLIAEAVPGFTSFVVTHFPLLRQRALLFQDVLEHVVADIVAAPFSRPNAPVNPHSLGAFHVSRLATALPHSVRMREAYSQLRFAIGNLYGAPRLIDPLWLSINTFAERRDHLRAMFAEDLNFLIVTLGPLSDSFLSSLLTAVLSHHPGWITSATPHSTDDNYFVPRPAHRDQSYDPLWAQLSDLFGAVTDPACTARTILIGRPPAAPVGPGHTHGHPHAHAARNIAARLLSVLSYFIRCNEVFELDEYPNSFEDITTKIYADPAGEVSSLLREPTDDDPASIAAAAAAAPTTFASALPAEALDPLPLTLTAAQSAAALLTPAAARGLWASGPAGSEPVTVVRRPSIMPLGIASIAEDDVGSGARSFLVDPALTPTPAAAPPSFGLPVSLSAPAASSRRVGLDDEGPATHLGNGGELPITPSSSGNSAFASASSVSATASSGYGPASAMSALFSGAPSPGSRSGSTSAAATLRRMDRRLDRRGTLDALAGAGLNGTGVGRARASEPLGTGSLMLDPGALSYFHHDEDDLNLSVRSSGSHVSNGEALFGPGSPYHITGLREEHEDEAITPRARVGRVNSEEFSFSPPRSINAFMEHFVSSVNNSLSLSRPTSRAASPGWLSPNATLDSSTTTALNATHRSVLSVSPTGSLNSNALMLCHPSPRASPPPSDPLRHFTQVSELSSDCRAIIPDLQYHESRSEEGVDFQHSFGRSLLAGQIESYVPGLVLQAVPTASFTDHLDRDLKADLRHSLFVPTPVRRASAVLVHLPTLQVEVRDVQQGQEELPARTSFGLPSSPVTSMLAAFHCLFSLGTSPRLCVQLIEDRLQLILLQSQAIAQHVRELARDRPASEVARHFSMTKRDVLFYWQVALMHCAPAAGRITPD